MTSCCHLPQAREAALKNMSSIKSAVLMTVARGPEAGEKVDAAPKSHAGGCPAGEKTRSPLRPFPCSEPQMYRKNPDRSKAPGSLGADQALAGTWGCNAQSLLYPLMAEGRLLGPIFSSG